MFCTKCGTQLPDDSRFCYKCGAQTHLAEQKDSIAESDPFDTPLTANYNPTPQPKPQTQPQQQQAPTTDDDGIFGLLGFIFAFLFPIIGLIFSIVGINKKKNGGLAAAGVMISVIIILLTICYSHCRWGKIRLQLNAKYKKAAKPLFLYRYFFALSVFKYAFVSGDTRKLSLAFWIALLCTNLGNVWVVNKGKVLS